MRKTAMIFSGQGAQTPGMMKEYYESVLQAKKVFDIADKVLNRSISSLCFEGTQEELNLTHNTQPCVLAADLAAYEAAKSKGYSADAVAGFSLGEYAALVVSGCLSIENAFKLVQIRADAMQEAVPVGQGAMAAIKNLSLKEVQALCDEVDGYVVPANINSPEQIVVSGENSAIDELVAKAISRKVRAVKLAVSAPFHCKLMEPATKKLEKVLREISTNDPQIPIYMNVDALKIHSKDQLIEKVIAQVTSPVYWQQTLLNMWDDGIDSFIECGPGHTLSGFVKKTLPEAEIITIEN